MHAVRLENRSDTTSWSQFRTAPANGSTKNAPKLQLGLHPEGISDILAVLNFLVAHILCLHAILVNAALDVVELVGQLDHLVGIALAEVLGALDGSTEILVDYGGEACGCGC